MSHDVFISYCHQDKPVADAVCAGLENAGLRCWIAPRDVEPGSEWGAAIIDAIAGCSVMVVVFSTHTNSSKQVLREVERCVSRGTTVVPLKVDDVVPSGSMEYYLGTPHWLDAMTPPLERHITRLAQVVRGIVEKNHEAVPSVAEQEKPGSRRDFNPSVTDVPPRVAPIASGPTEPTRGSPRAVWKQVGIATVGTAVFGAVAIWAASNLQRPKVPDKVVSGVVATATSTKPSAEPWVSPVPMPTASSSASQSRELDAALRQLALIDDRHEPSGNHQPSLAGSVGRKSPEQSSASVQGRTPLSPSAIDDTLQSALNAYNDLNYTKAIRLAQIVDATPNATTAQRTTALLVIGGANYPEAETGPHHRAVALAAFKRLAQFNPGVVIPQLIRWPGLDSILAEAKGEGSGGTPTVVSLSVTSETLKRAVKAYNDLNYVETMRFAQIVDADPNATMAQRTTAQLLMGGANYPEGEPNLRHSAAALATFRKLLQLNPTATMPAAIGWPGLDSIFAQAKRDNAGGKPPG